MSPRVTATDFARLGPQPFHHRGRCVNPLHGDPPGRQRQRDPAGPDGQLQHPPVSGQAGQELHRGPWGRSARGGRHKRPPSDRRRTRDHRIRSWPSLKQTQATDATHLPAQADQSQHALICREVCLHCRFGWTYAPACTACQVTPRRGPDARRPASRQQRGSVQLWLGRRP